MRHTFRVSTAVFFLLFSLPAFSQEKKSISLEDVWAKGTFRGQYVEGFNWMTGDKHYSSIQNNKIVRQEALTGNVVETIFPNTENIKVGDYIFNAAEDKLLISSESEPIYRYSFVAFYYLYDLSAKSLKKIFPEKISYATFSPDGQKAAFVHQNNLYSVDLASLESTQITQDGKTNFIINGSTDWVYEEEFSFTKAFFWSPDSKKIAFYRFDESEVKEYNMQVWDDLYPTDYRYKYPKAGEKNSTISIHCYFLETGKKITIDIGEEKDIYIPRMTWTNHPDIVSIQRLNRLQNKFELIHANIATNQTNIPYTESNNSYVEITDDLTYLKDGKHFILSSEKDGYRHLYKYDLSGKLVTQLTSGNWEVDKFLGIHEKSGRVFYTSTEISPLERHLYSIDLNGKKKKKLTEAKGVHEIELSKDFTYFNDVFSTLNTPHTISLHQTATGKLEKVLVSNDGLKKKLEEYKISQGEFFEFTTSDKISLNGYMIKPQNFNASQKYPVLLFVYGGPGHQGVNNAWMGPNYFWFQMLAQQGYVIVSIDNRGTGGRGAAFKKITQNQLGKYETQDVIHTAKYLGNLPFIDKSRIGIFGWSFGGYLSSLAMTLGADYFKAGIAVAPVTSWRFYDTIYTERYLGLPQQNAAGYDENSPLSHAEKLKGNYLLIHGTADDNVHVQNSYAMQNALIKANKQFDVFYYPDRNHGIYGGITRYHLYKMMTDFIYKKL